ncbi:MAG: glycosyltransferase family 39 protein [Chloroflexi bacterium]|nr:glycosyltransferase family 39 protein [Chloroflexota bacterium]
MNKHPSNPLMQTTSPPWHTHPHLSRWAFIALLLLSYGLLVSSSLQKSATVDEQSHLFRGTAYLKANATHFLWGHPLLASSFNALPLLTEPDLQLPQDDPAWHSEQWWTAADAFLWLRNASPLRLLFLGRLPTMWLTLLVGAMLYRWGRELGGRQMALLSAALWLLDPNVLAHGQLITSDVALTLCFVLTLYGTWRYAQSGSGGAPLLLAGMGLGMAGATKFNAAALLPIFGLLLAGLAVRQRRWQPLAFGLGAGVIALAVISAVYRFNLAPCVGRFGVAV